MVVVLGLSAAAFRDTADGMSTVTVSVPIPSATNVSVARLVLRAGAAPSTPARARLSLAGTRGLPRGAVVVQSVAPGSARGQYLATIAILRPSASTVPAPASPTTASLLMRVPPGFTIASPLQAAKDVLYQNALPAFPIVAGGIASVLAGESPKLPLDRIVMDAQLLAFDRSVPLAEIGLMRLPYVSASFGVRSNRMRVTIGISELAQVNAVELKFASGITVAGSTGPAGTEGLPVQNGIQLVASHGFFQAGVAYRFTLSLSRAPKRGESVVVRASTHYFENALPFTGRVVLQ